MKSDLFIPTRKKHYKYTLIANNLVCESRLRVLPVTVRWLLITLLLIAGDQSRDTVELSERQLRDLLESSWSVERALNALQELQLLTYEKTNFLLNRKEKNRKEKEVNRIEVQRGADVVKKQESDNNKNLNAKIWEAYKQAYFLRYKTEPVRNASVNSKISQLAKRLGADAEKIVVFYVNHNDPFYIRQLHQIGACLTNAEALYTQFKRGVAILPRDVKNFEQNQNMNDLMNELKKGGF